MIVARAERLLNDLKTPDRYIQPKGCPPGAGLVGSKLDLPPGGEEYETSPLLLPCAYRGLNDTKDGGYQNRPTLEWRYYKLAVQRGQTVKVTFRMRDKAVDYPFQLLKVRLHQPNGALAHEDYAMQPAEGKAIEYKAEQMGFAYVSVNGVVRGAAFEFSVH